MIVRSATTTDIPPIRGILARTRLLTNISTVSQLERKITQVPGSILVAEDNDVIAGTVFLVLDPWVSVIYHLVVDELYRRQGVGTALLAGAEAQAKSVGAALLTLYIKPEEGHLKTFYEKRGWRLDRKYFSFDKKIT